MNTVLTNSNFIIFAAKNYSNVYYDEDEFKDDLQKFKYLKRLLNRYKEHGELKPRLILNHIIVIQNIFGPQPTTKMLYLKLEGFEKYLNPFLDYLGILPKYVENVREKGFIKTEDYGQDPGIKLMLQEDLNN